MQLPGEAFVVVWSGFVEFDRTADLFAQRFDRMGTPIGAIFPMSTPVSDPSWYDVTPELARIGGNRVAVAWTSTAADGDEYAVMARVFDLGAEPVPITVDFVVNTYTPGRQYLQSIAATADGFIVTWADTGALGVGRRHVFAQRFAADGERLGTEVEVPQTGRAFDPTVPKVGAHRDGSFVVTWTSEYGQDGEGEGIFARTFNRDASPSSDDFVVNSQTLGSQGLSDIAVRPDDSFVVVWADYSDRLVKGQLFTAEHTKLGSEFAISQYSTTYSVDPEVDTFADGSFVVAWTNGGQDGDNYGVVARRFTPAAEADGSEFIVNTYTTFIQGRNGARDSLNVTVLSDHSFVIVWDSQGGPRESTGIFLQRFCVMANNAFGCGDAACPPAGVSGGLAASDAMVVLRAALALESCALCVCDTNGSLAITASDALGVLRSTTVGGVPLACPAC